ncbi:peptidoglycan-binding protein [Planktomarina temperata]|nr:peptidoglycan-binding protein [Planktomarina temperata]
MDYFGLFLYAVFIINDGEKISKMQVFITALIFLLIVCVAPNSASAKGNGYGWLGVPGAENCGTRVSVQKFKDCVDKFGIIYEERSKHWSKPRTGYLIDALTGDAASGSDKEKRAKLSYVLRKGGSPNRVVGNVTPLMNSLWNQNTPAMSYLLIQHGAKMDYHNPSCPCDMLGALRTNSRGLKSYPKLKAVLQGKIKLKPMVKVSSLRVGFNRLPKQQRKEIQRTLKDLGFYKSTIDGLYGRGTRSALEEYNKKYFNKSDLGKTQVVTDLIQALMVHKTQDSIKPQVIVRTQETKETVSANELKLLTKKLGLSLYGSFLHTSNVPNAIFFFDEIRKSDSFEFRKALRNHDIDLIVLSSPGGSVFEGLQMAGIIHDKNLNTYIPSTGFKSQKGVCASACSYMFFAGKSRQSQGLLGVHQVYTRGDNATKDIAATEKIAQFTVSEIIGFLNEFDTPPWVFEKMFQQSKMYYFDEAEIEAIERSAETMLSSENEEIETFIRNFKSKFE